MMPREELAVEVSTWIPMRWPCGPLEVEQARRRDGFTPAEESLLHEWLLTASLESFLAGHTGVALPGFVASLVLFAACAGLYRLVVRLDRTPETEDRPTASGPWVIG